jgi:hypothetical protein
MCGLVGAAGNLVKKDLDVFNNMLVVDVLRGAHSTGVFSSTVNRDHRILKQAVAPLDLMCHRDYRKVVHSLAQVVMGHNRYATSGKINNLTAHPFHYGDIVGAHNGTLRGWNVLDDHQNFDVDSECLIYNIDKNGIEDTIAKVNGAFSLSLYNTKERTLHLLRNEERPLHFAYKEGMGALYWASEPWMIRAMANRQGVGLHKNQVYNLKEGTLLTFELPDKLIDGVNKPRRKELKLLEKKPQGVGNKGNTNIQNIPHTKSTGTTGGTGSLGVVSGDKVIVVPVDVAEDNGRWYVACCASASPWGTCRMYCSKERAETILASGRDLEGTVQGVIQVRLMKNDGEYSDPYFTLNPATAILLDDPVDLCIGPSGNLIDEDEFNKLTKEGCCVCSGNVFFEDSLEWFNNQPVCPACQELDSKSNVIYLGDS